MLALSESEYTVKSSISYVVKVKREKNQSHYKIVSFTVKALFTNVLSDRTVRIFRIFNRKEITADTSLQEMKDLQLFASVVFIFHLVMWFIFKMMELLQGLSWVLYFSVCFFVSLCIYIYIYIYIYNIYIYIYIYM